MKSARAGTVALAAILAAGAPGQVANDVDAEKKLITRLIDQLGIETQAHAAEAALARIGRPAVTALVSAIHPGGEIELSRRKQRALRVLGRMGPTAAAAMTPLIEALGSASDAIYLDILHAIADLVPYADVDADARFIERLIHSNQAMAQKFSGRGLDGVRGRGLSNDRARFQYEFNRLQKRALVDAKAGLDAMIAEIERNLTHRREVAAEVVGRMGKAAKRALPALSKAMRKGAPVVGQIGGFRVPKYRDGFPAAASEAMLRIDPADPRSAVAWAWQLEHANSEEARMRAALRLGGFGEHAAAEVPTLIDALRDRSARVRQESITALGMIGPRARQAVPSLQRIAKGKDKAAAGRAAAALQRIAR